MQRNQLNYLYAYLYDLEKSLYTQTVFIGCDYIALFVISTVPLILVICS